MAIAYTYTKYKDVHTLINDGVLPMTYTITNITCDSETTVKTGVIQPDNASVLTFITDGEYSVLLDDGDTTQTFTIKTFENLLASLIREFENILCGCSKCNDCEECESCEDFMQTLVKSFSFYSLNFPLYQAFSNSLITNTYCDLLGLVNCVLIKERVYGKAEVRDIIMKIIRDYYGTFYYKDLAMAVDDEEKEYVSTKYKAPKILKCIRKLGTNPSQILDDTEANSKVYFWQLASISDDINDVIPLISQPYLDTKPNLPFTDFELGHTVTYTGTAPIVFAVGPTQIEDFIIKDSMNNDITDQFDTHYFDTLAIALFVSKTYYSVSNVYFKFKKDF